MLEHAANAAHECAEGHALPWFACIDQCKDFGPYLLVLVVLLLLSTAIEFIFRKLDDLGAALGKGGGRVVSISTAPPPNADPPKSGSLNELSVELSSVQSI